MAPFTLSLSSNKLGHYSYHTNMVGCVDILKLREEVLNLPYSTPIPETGNAYEVKRDDSVAIVENVGTHIAGYVDILELRKRVLDVPHPNPEPSNTEEAEKGFETLEITVNENVLLEKQPRSKIPQHSRKILTFQKIFTFGKVHWCCMMALIEAVDVNWSVVAVIPNTQVTHRTARDRWKMG